MNRPKARMIRATHMVRASKSNVLTFAVMTWIADDLRDGKGECETRAYADICEPTRLCSSVNVSLLGRRI